MATQRPVGQIIVQTCAILAIVNDILGTNCDDSDALDVTGAWEIIVEELKPDAELIRTLGTRYQPGMTLAEAGKVLGLSVGQVYERCLKAMHKLRHPCRVRRIRNSIMGWPNLYRDTRRWGQADDWLASRAPLQLEPPRWPAQNQSMNTTPTLLRTQGRT